MGRPRLLTPEFFARDTARVARELLGGLLVSTVGGVRVAGRIVETEAYVGPDDPAAHGWRNRRSRRNARLFGPPGTAYVYFIYGMHWCVNAVTEREGFPAAVLIRALEPVDGVAHMQTRRGLEDPTRLCSGPAKLCEALGIDGELNGAPLDGGPLAVYAGMREALEVRATGRIGVSRAADWPLRFVVAGSPYASRPAPSRRRSRAR